ncbi:hypothetical protein VZQ01_00170 [Myxococcus faecalis]|jgi:hypothetical protein|uniref:hypothetical protein n=1 Tax=Myxococcus faecalis TaxID=3115646 RepID=UPI0024C774DA|nr:hypothetical protein MFMH1_38170 [Myxococcus sp. MH1]
MARTRWKWLTLLGLGTSLVAFAGCEDGEVRENSRQMGREVGKAAKDVREGTREAAKDMKTAAEEASQGFKEGMGGAGEAGEVEETPDARERSLEDHELPAETPAR